MEKDYVNKMKELYGDDAFKYDEQEGGSGHNKLKLEKMQNSSQMSYRDE